MAEQKRKSQAEKAATSAKSKNTKNSSSGKNAAAMVSADQEKTRIPVRIITSLFFLGLFTLLLVTFLKPEGALVEIFSGFIHGLMGRVGFIVAIPATLYLFYVHAFSGKRPIRMRTICIISFTLICGCIAHLAANPENISTGFALLSELYMGGISGETGGLLCGGTAMLLHWLCGSVISYIVFIVAAVFTLLGGMQITIPSIIRAVQNRPRLEWEEDEKQEQQDPAAVVVNHIVNKQNAYKERRRIRSEQMVIPEVIENVPEKTTASSKKESAVPNKKVDEIIRQIDADIEMPVAAANSQESKNMPKPEPVAAQEHSVPEIVDESFPVIEEVPVSMPLLDRTEPTVPVPSKKETAVVPTARKVKVTAKEAEKSANEVAQEIADAEAVKKPAYCFPPIDLLKVPSQSAADGTAEMRENTRRLNETLASFRIEAHITNVTRGPSVTRYDVELEKGVRLSKLTTAADDIALSLGATGVRIAAVPGKISVVGIEVPNRAVTTVSLREVIDSQEFSKAKSKSSFSVGKDISGNCIIGNIARLPHMLIAGTTGSGKSVCMNSIIISLLYKASPDDVKLIMVDPKMVELGIYNGIPHLLIPVVTDPKKAAGSLQWAVTEMMRRYKAMSDAGVRDLESYNSIIESQEVDGNKLPQVVVIIDELADLMLVAAKEVEESICRIAQMGRAAGIHLIIATQRPSADVITGLMKANIPSRIAFAVASAMESRIILDTQGAEKLVGKGDMLYAPIGCGKPKRVQGCYVSDSEVEAVASYVKNNFVTDYDQQVMEEIEKKAAQSGTKGSSAAAEPEASEAELEGDEMLPAAVDVILETGQASVSMLQRRLKLGYARAARIVDEMEEKGIVGPFVGSKPRAILVTKEQWEAMRSGSTPTQLDFSDIEEETNAGFLGDDEDFL